MKTKLRQTVNKGRQPHASPISIERCPKFETCSAPICPLDCDYKLRSYLDGEPVCFYMMEFVKPNGEAIIRGVIGSINTKLVAQAIQSPKCSYGLIQKRLKRASRTPSRLGVST